MHAARHEIVARPFRRRLGENRRLDLPEALRVEVLANRHRDAVPQPDVVLHAGAPQVEVPVAEPHLLGHAGLVGDRERGRLRLGEHADFAREHFDLAGRQPGVDRVFRSALHHADDGHDVLRAEALGDGHQRLVVADDDLREPGAVADVDEGDAAEVADAVHPAEERGLGADILRTEGAAGVCSGQIAKLIGH